ncbi:MULTISPECIES: ABC transporter permease [Maricaulis]|uniref:ABC-2 type transport system permease protein n=1 Tax=Maricaulis maris TaxID=74318 RepID=A0A495DL54_9PROT|nr:MULTISPECIES: ABC transporter permease [Maricaulis]RKR03663.1 ABC-2 type transport system permease protein [Maricaulis maris]
MRAIYLIARREYLSYAATWGFWLSLASMPLFMALGFGLPILIENSQPTRYYVLIDETGGSLETALEAQAEASQAEALERARETARELFGDLPQVNAALASQPQLSDERYLRVDVGVSELDALRPYLTGDATFTAADGEHRLFAAIYLRQNADGAIQIDYWSANVSDGGLRSQIRNALRAYMQTQFLIDSGVDPGLIETADELSPSVRELNPERTGDTAEVTDAERIPLVVSTMMAIGLWAVIFSVVNMLLTAMIEEKGNKVLEMMLASTRHHEILTGKLIGVAAVSATLLAVWGGIGLLGTLGLQQVAASSDMPIADILAAVLDPGLLLPAFGYFIIGYLMYGAVFLAIGSLCETLQDAQTLMSPMMLIMMVPIILIMMALNAPDNPIVAIASWVPLWTPFIMLARLPHDVGLIDIVGTTAAMIAFAVFVIWGSGVLFRMGSLNQANQDTVKGWFRIGRKKKPAAS